MSDRRYTTAMPKQKLLTERRLIQFDADLAAQIADFRFRERFASETAAVRELITRGLKASKPDPKPKAKR